MLRHTEDRLPLLLLLSLFAVDLAAWWFVRSPLLVAAWALASLLPKAFVCAFNHHHPGRWALAALLLVAGAARAEGDWELPRGLTAKGAVAVVVDRQVLLRKLGRLDELVADSAGASSQPQEVQRRAMLRGLLAQVRGELDLAPELGSLRRPAAAAGLVHSAQGEADKAAADKPRAPAPVQQQAPAISDEAFGPLADEVAHEAFADDRLSLLRDRAKTLGFTVAQAARLLAAFPYPGDRLRGARILWPRVVDRANGAQLYDSFTFQSEKDELRAVLAE